MKRHPVLSFAPLQITYLLLWPSLALWLVESEIDPSLDLSCVNTVYCTGAPLYRQVADELNLKLGGDIYFSQCKYSMKISMYLWMNEWMNEWKNERCVRSQNCTVYYPEHWTALANEMRCWYESYPRCRNNHSTFWPAVQHVTTMSWLPRSRVCVLENVLNLYTAR